MCSSDLDALSDRIVIIDRGRIVAADTSENLKAQVSGDLVSLEVADPAARTTVAEKLGSIAEPPRHGLPGVEIDGVHVRGRIQRAGRALPGLLSSLHDAGVVLDAIEVHRPTLDDVFLTLTGRSLRDAEAGGEDGEAAAQTGAHPTTTDDMTGALR